MRKSGKLLQFNKRISVLIVLLSLSPLGYGKNLKDCSFYIGDFESAQTAMNFMTSKNRYHNLGLCIDLVEDTITNELFVYPQYDLISFPKFAKKLNLFIEDNSKVIFPLFIRFNGDHKLLYESLHKTGLYDKSTILPIGEHCPPIADIVESGKQILLFCFPNKSDSNELLNYTWNSIAEFPSSLWGETIFDGGFLNGSIERELLLLRDYYPSEQQYVNQLRSRQSDMEITYSLLDRALRIWTKCGKRPNFVFYSEPKHTKQISWLIDMLSSYEHRTGSATHNGKPIRRVLWGDNFENVTNGNFDFPITEGYNLTLRPKSLGYSFTPEFIELENEHENISNLNFEATKLPLSYGLTGYYDLDFSINNQVNSKWFSENENYTFVKDLERGNVLKMKERKLISLQNSTELRIVNNSFTISAWFKLNECNDYADYCIIGTSGRQYRKGLHANIRQKTPYFGFYNNDIRANMTIDANRWYNFTIRYDIQEGEQCIFIDGKKMGSSRNHPSFLGESPLLLGHGIQQKNYANGYIDDLFVWSRALNDTEINDIYLNGLILPDPVFYTTPWFKTVLCSLLLIISIMSFWFYFSRSHLENEIKKKSIVYDVQAMKQKNNSIYLFGEFRVVNNRGEEITSNFSPKLKEAFLLILLHSLKYKHGVSIRKLNETLWPDFTVQKAANNRGVTMNKLKKLLLMIDGVDIFYDDGVWNAKVDSDFNCDYIIAHQEIYRDGQVSTLVYSKLFSLIERGVLLKDSDYHWLDEYRSSLLFDITDMMLSYAHLLSNAKEYDFLFKVASSILDRDDLNEEAIFYQLEFLRQKGHHKKAKFTFDSFINRYAHCYGEPYALSYANFLSQHNNK